VSSNILLLAVAVALVGALCLLNSMLLVATFRRLKEHEDRLLVGFGGRSPFDYDPSVLAGKPVPEVAAATADGQVVDQQTLSSAATLVGFFSVGCRPCHQQAPSFAELAGSDPTTGAVAVVAGGDGPDRDELIGLLGDAALVVGTNADEVAAAFGVVAFPTFVRTDGAGRIAAATLTVAELAESSRYGPRLA
jgi:thiol-disulfide isomerase/thioredoxin